MKIHLHSLAFALFISGTIFLHQETMAQDPVPASPKGGFRQANEFMDEEMVYPAEALAKSIEGTVMMEFIVLPQGAVKDLKCRPANPLLEKEALRIFSLLVWEPARFHGKAVESVSSFEVPFSVKHYRKVCKKRGYTTPELPFAPMDSSGKIYLYKNIDSPPSLVFKDKNMNLQNFLADNFVYPDEALKRNITGTVKVNFIVEPHGRISNVNVVEFLGAGCAEEAVRLIKELRFKPGIKDGKAVRVNMSMPVTFGLTADGNYKVTPAAGGTSFQ